jgi:hypothetical protein
VDAAGKFVGYLSTNLETVTMNANGFPVVLPVGPAGFRLIPFQTFGLFFDNASCTGQKYMLYDDSLTTASGAGFSYYAQAIIGKNISQPQTTFGGAGVLFVPDRTKATTPPVQYYGNFNADGSGLTACTSAANMSPQGLKVFVPVTPYNLNFKTPFRMK